MEFRTKFIKHLYHNQNRIYNHSFYCPTIGFTGCLDIHNGGVPGVLTNNTTQVRPDPETGIVNWIQAINESNMPRLYELSPAYIRNNVSESDFTSINEKAPMLAPGTEISRYEVVNKSVEDDSANIKAIIGRTSVVNNTPETIPIFFNFSLSYENNEWKVWTVPF